VDDAAIVSGLVGGYAVFLLQHDDAPTRESASKLKGGGESHNTCADDDEVHLAIMHKLDSRVIIRTRRGILL